MEFNIQIPNEVKGNVIVGMIDDQVVGFVTDHNYVVHYLVMVNGQSWKFGFEGKEGADVHVEIYDDMLTHDATVTSFLHTRTEEHVQCTINAEKRSF